MSVTRPPAIEIEARKLAQDIIDSAHDELQYRVKMASLAATTQAEVRFLQLTLDAHVKSDDTRFEALDRKYGLVSSQVGAGEKIQQKFEGAGLALKTLLALIALFAGIGGFVLWVMGIKGNSP